MIYLDNSATSWPKPREVHQAVLDAVKTYGANPGRSGHKMSIAASSEIFKCRMSVAEFFGIDDPSKVIFTLNATDSLNIAIKGILKENDHVIVSSMEHNSVLRPIYALSQEKGVTYDMVYGNVYGYVSAEDIEKAIKPNTALIILTHASNVCGTVNPIREVGAIARKHNIPFLVDASQSAGILPIDVEKDNIDILATAGHKGLYGPVGVGVLYVKDASKINTIKEGGTGSNSMDLKQPSVLPDKFESGTINTVGIMGLMAGINFINKIGLDEIAAHEKKLTGMMIERLAFTNGVSVYGYLHTGNRLGVVSFNISGVDSVEVAKYLDEKYNIAVRAGYHCAYTAHQTIGTETLGTVRASVGALNTASDIETLCNAVKEIKL